MLPQATLPEVVVKTWNLLVEDSHKQTFLDLRGTARVVTSGLHRVNEEYDVDAKTCMFQPLKQRSKAAFGLAGRDNPSQL